MIDKLVQLQKLYTECYKEFGICGVDISHVHIHKVETFRNLVPVNVPITTGRNGAAIELWATVEGVKLLVLI